jgi:hypothetical protein
MTRLEEKRIAVFRNVSNSPLNDAASRGQQHGRCVWLQSHLLLKTHHTSEPTLCAASLSHCISDRQQLPTALDDLEPPHPDNVTLRAAAAIGCGPAGTAQSV